MRQTEQEYRRLLRLGSVLFMNLASGWIFFIVTADTQTQVTELEKAIVAFKTVTKEKFIDPAKACDLWEGEALRAIQQEIGEVIQFGDIQKRLTGTMIRYVVNAHRLESPTPMYYRPEKPGSRAMYGRAFVDWVVDEYRKDSDFFHKAKLALQPDTLPSNISSNSQA